MSAFYIGNPGLIQKLKVSNCVCRLTLASACNEPTLFAIFSPARGQIFGKNYEKILKTNDGVCVFCGQNQENEGSKILDSGIPKFSRRRPMPAFSPSKFSATPTLPLQYLAPLGAKYLERRPKKYKKSMIFALIKAKLSSRDQVGC